MLGGIGAKWRMLKMARIARAALLLIVVCLITAGCGPKTVGSIHGVVTDAVTGLPIPGATVRLAGASVVTGTTNASGSYKLTKVPADMYCMTVTAGAYIARIVDDVLIMQDIANELDLSMVSPGDVDVLLYQDGPETIRFAQAAADDLGLNTTTITDKSLVNANLTGWAWHLVLIDNPSAIFELSTLNAIEGYVENGGALVMSTFLPTWNTAYAAHTLWGELGADFATESEIMDGAVFTVHRWDADHPIFTAPDLVPDPRLAYVWHIIKGVGGSETPNGDAVAGITGALESGSGLIFVADSQRAVLNSFLLDCMAGSNWPYPAVDDDSDGTADAVELWRNEILYVLSRTDAAAVKAPAGGSAACAGAVVAGGSNTR